MKIEFDNWMEGLNFSKITMAFFLRVSNGSKQRIIHGDFNLGNILDLSWACLLLRIYLSESKSLTFLNKYQEGMPAATGELEIFEALACLRWLLLDQIDGVPKHANTMMKIKKIVRDNRYLNSSNG